MKKLLEICAFILLVAAILVLFFIFDGSPDLWDKWHDLAIVMFVVLAVAPEAALQIMLAGTWVLMIIAGIGSMIYTAFFR